MSERLFRDIELATAPLRGIIHAAGIIDDGVVIEQTWPRVAHVLAPKMIGASLLARYARDLPLDFFICYSSATGVFGSPGQSSYSAANSYLGCILSGAPSDGSSGDQRAMGRVARYRHGRTAGRAPYRASDGERNTADGNRSRAVSS